MSIEERGVERHGMAPYLYPLAATAVKGGNDYVAQLLIEIVRVGSINVVRSRTVTWHWAYRPACDILNTPLNPPAV